MGAEDGLETTELIGRTGRKARREDIPRIPEVLDGKLLGPAKPEGNVCKGVLIVELGGDGGAELIVHSAGEEKRCRAADGGEIHGSKAAGFGVPGGAVFDVHGHKVHQFFRDQRLEQVGEGAVSVSLTA